MALISKVSQRFSLHPNEGFITLGIFSIVSIGFQIFQHVGLTKVSLNPNEGFICLATFSIVSIGFQLVEIKDQGTIIIQPMFLAPVFNFLKMCQIFLKKIYACSQQYALQVCKFWM